MVERYPFLVCASDGECVGRVRDIGAASALVRLVGTGATLWFGCDDPQKVYTDDGENNYMPFDYIDRAVADGLMGTWDEWKAVYEEEAERMGAEWLEMFREYVWRSLYEVPLSEKAFMTDEKFFALHPELDCYRDGIRHMPLPPVVSIPDDEGDEQD